MEGLSAQPRLWVRHHLQYNLKIQHTNCWYLAGDPTVRGWQLAVGRVPRESDKHKKDAMSTQGPTGPCRKHPLKASSINQFALVS